MVLSPTDVQNATDGVVNPASARLRDGTLQLYPRLVARGNVSRIGSFSIAEEMDGSVSIDQGPCALEPQAPYEIRTHLSLAGAVVRCDVAGGDSRNGRLRRISHRDRSS